MLRDELLRAKNDEIARCLLSRKRKLSELYYATLGATGNSPEADLYRQKEAEFLKANDITEGRYYNENTLPPRPDLAIIKPPDEDTTEITNKQHAGSPTDVSTPASTVTSNQPVPPSPLSSQHGPSDTTDQNGVHEHASSRDVSVLAEISGSRERSQQAVESSDTRAAFAPGREALRAVQPKLDDSGYLRDSLTKPKVYSPVVGGSPSAAAAPTLQLENASLRPDAGRTSPSVVTVGLPARQHEGMSPVSSGPSCGHTSGSEASPKSSSTEESLAPLLDTAQGSKAPEDNYLPGRRHGIPAPDLVPSTPDEQLKLEAAMSYQTSYDSSGQTASHPGFVHEPPDVPLPEKTTPPDVDKLDTSESVAPPPSSLNQQDETADALLSTEKRVDTLDSALEAASQQLSTPPGSDLPPSEEPPRTAALDEPTLDREPSHPVPPVSPNAPPSSTRHVQTDVATSLVKVPTSKAKPHSKISTVLFPKQPSTRKGESAELAQRTSSFDAVNEEQDYLYTLFQAKAHYPPRSMNLTTLVSTAHKTLSTANHFLDYEEQMSCRTLKRVYQLQNASKWPLRQLQRAAEPQRTATHWDVLVDHAKWMSADFKEERKWRISAAKRCADWCAEYIASDEEGRSMLRIRIKRKPSKLRNLNPDSIPTPSQEIDGHEADAHPTPELIPSRDDDSASDNFDDDVHPYLDDHTTPAGIFALGSDEFTFQLDSTPAADKILDELPQYAPTGICQDTSLPAFKVHPDHAWKKDLLPVSKYATATLPSENTEPPRKRSRYDHCARDMYDLDDFNSVPIPPDQTDVALFQPENKHIRDRIHPGHSFRPPTEYGMPSLGFYESRQSSQWTYAEDDELRRLVREYSYNWSLISSCLTPRSRFMSGADRRTPWECFERWIGLEGLPADMAKTPYFRAYSARLEAAQRNVLAAQQQAAQQLQQQQQQQGNNNPAAQALMRRRTTQPVRVERKRNTRHLALLAGMRKLAQKREAQLQKQQHATHLASLRKANESNQPRPTITTPVEFSRLKHERELKHQERTEQYRQHMFAQQRAALAQRLAQQQAANQQLSNGIPGRNPSGIPANGTGQVVPGKVPPNVPNGLGANGAMVPGRPHIPGLPNGIPANGPMGGAAMALKMVPQPGVQQPPLNGRPVPATQASPDNARILREANRLQEQQRLVQSRQQQHQFHTQPQVFAQQGPHSSPNMGMSTPNPNPNTAAMMAAFQASGVGSPSFHAPVLAQGASPRMNQPNPLTNPAGMPNIAALQQSLHRNHPNLPADQVNKLANERLQQYQQHRMSQAALNAAAGNIGSIPTNFKIPTDPNDQQVPQPGVPNGAAAMQASQMQGYSPLMRVNQPGQPNRMNVNGSPAMNGMVIQQSRNATPQPHRTGSGQSGSTAPGKSPRHPQAQTASG